MFQFQARKSCSRNSAINICALALARWNELLIGLSLKRVLGQQSWGLCSTDGAVVVFLKVLPSRQSCSYVFTSWACTGPPSGLLDQPGSPYLHWGLSAQVSLGGDLMGWAICPPGCPQRPTWGCLEHREQILPMMAHLVLQTQISFCWGLVIRELLPVPASPLFPGCMLGHAGFVFRFFKYFALWFSMQCSRYFAKGTL